MHNFIFQNPVKIVFGRGKIANLVNLIPENSKILIIYGGGSIKTNGVYNQVTSALSDFEVYEFGGIEANPEYQTCLSAVEICQNKKIDFILAVGGGSVIDAAKFVAAAVNYPSTDKWQILKGGANKIIKVIKFGTVLTLPATGSEMNSGSVISRREFNEKAVFFHPSTYPQFSILDPETTYTLNSRQLTNGLVDPFIHVTEQYLTTDINTPIQDGFAETILKTLITIGPKIYNGDMDYDTRAIWMWSATNALNGYIGIGVDQDWATHVIGHELTVKYNLDHAQTLALIAPQIWQYKKSQKHAKLLKFARNVWQITKINEEQAIDEAIKNTVEFFNKIGAKTKFSDHKIIVNAQEIADNVKKNNNIPLGEGKDIYLEDIIKIVQMAQ